MTMCFIDPVSRSDLATPHPVHLTTAYLCGFRLPPRKEMTTALLWAITQRVVAIPYRLIGTSMTLKITIVCPETSVRNYHFSLLAQKNAVLTVCWFRVIPKTICDGVWCVVCMLRFRIIYQTARRHQNTPFTVTVVRTSCLT